MARTEKLKKERSELLEHQVRFNTKADQFLQRASEDDRKHSAAREIGVAGDDSKLKEARRHADAAADNRAFAAYHSEEVQKIGLRIAELDKQIAFAEREDLKQQALESVRRGEKKIREAVAKFSEFLVVSRQGAEVFEQIAAILLLIDGQRLASAAAAVRGRGPRLFVNVALCDLAKAFPDARSLLHLVDRTTLGDGEDIASSQRKFFHDIFQTVETLGLSDENPAGKKKYRAVHKVSVGIGLDVCPGDAVFLDDDTARELIEAGAVSEIAKVAAD